MTELLPLVRTLLRMRAGFFGAALLCSATACTAATREIEEAEDETTAAPSSAPIVGGALASAYPEAVLVDMYEAGASWPSSICSGSVIAPRVVLTAGHCVEGFAKWRIKAPFAGNQTVSASSAGTYDWAGVSGGTVDPSRHDVGLVFLDAPISLSSYPTVASAAVASGSSLVNVGRIQDGVASNTSLFVGAPVTVRSGSTIGHPYAYYTTEIIQSGDSGGPCIVPGSTPHKIAAVNSGAGGGTQVLARTDLVFAWIDGQVKAHGGWASAATPPPPPPPPSTACTAKEAESNDSYTAPNALPVGTSCGALGAGDQDWFSWSMGSTSVSYSIALTTTGDAQLQMWKLVNGSYYRVSNTTATTFNKTTSGAGTFVLVVWSPTGAAQSYSVAFKK